MYTSQLVAPGGISNVAEDQTPLLPHVVNDLASSK